MVQGEVVQGGAGWCTARKDLRPIEAVNSLEYRVLIG